MPCSKVAINKSFQCDKSGCICIPTNGKSCICVCANEAGDIIRCDDCKCENTDTCGCKCDNAKCICIDTKGADCVCVCRDGKNSFKACFDCSCTETNEKDVAGKSGVCCTKKSGKEVKESSDVLAEGTGDDAKYRCDKPECICITTKRKSCICVCENENGEIISCNDCKCENTGTCQCKCDDAKCVCIDTKGADCVCICRDGKGNFKACLDCSCSESNEKDVAGKSGVCCTKKSGKEVKESSDVLAEGTGDDAKYRCDKPECICIPTNGKSCICVCENENGEIISCKDCKCENTDSCESNCDDAKCVCIDTKGADCVCVCRDGKGSFKACLDCSCSESNEKDVAGKSGVCCTKKSGKEVKESSDVLAEGTGDDAKYRCDKPECICIPTKGKSCICVCENENGEIISCKDCKCENTDSCESNCDDAKCVCIDTKGADCVFVCRDGKGSFKACLDCSCSESSEKDVAGKSGVCCIKKSGKQVEESSDVLAEGTGDDDKYRCNKPECICIPTKGKSCICVCENENGEIISCNDCKCENTGTCQCKCDDAKCVCIDTKGADCVCVCRDGKRSFKACSDCSCSESNEKDVAGKSGVCCTKKSGKEVKESSDVLAEGTGDDAKYRCDKPECICIPTKGKSCICVCENENGEIISCNDCKCENTGTCQCKCDDAKCVCIDTKGAGCVCVCRDGKGSFKACLDCSCSESNEKDVTGKSGVCCTKKSGIEVKESSDVLAEGTGDDAKYRCDKPECICIPTKGKSCICVCENENGEIISCNDCKCENTDSCESKCDDAKCVCIDTKGADCVCVCRDGKGSFKACFDCSCSKSNDKKLTGESVGCCAKIRETMAC